MIGIVDHRRPICYRETRGGPTVEALAQIPARFREESAQNLAGQALSRGELKRRDFRAMLVVAVLNCARIASAQDLRTYVGGVFAIASWDVESVFAGTPNLSFSNTSDADNTLRITVLQRLNEVAVRLVRNRSQGGRPSGLGPLGTPISVSEPSVAGWLG